MLILTRRVGEKLVIGDNVKVTVLGVKGHQVRIGIDAPRDVTVNREEIYQRILAEKKALNGISGSGLQFLGFHHQTRVKRGGVMEAIVIACGLLVGHYVYFKLGHHNDD